MTIYILCVPGTWETKQDDRLREPEGLLKDIVNLIPPSIEGHLVVKKSIGYIASFGDAASATKSMEDGIGRLVMAIRQVPQGSYFFLAGFSQGCLVAGQVARAIGQGELNVESTCLGYYGVSDAKRNREVIGPAINGMGLLGPRGHMGSLHGREWQFAAPGDVICSTDSNTSLLPLIAPYVMDFWVGDPVRWIQACIAFFRTDKELERAVREEFVGIRGWIKFHQMKYRTMDDVAKYLISGVHGSYPRYLVWPGQTVPEWVATNTVQVAVKAIQEED
jgi:hypothetical protein